MYLHQNTINSYIEEMPNMSKRAKHIYDFLLETSGTYTDRQVMEQLGYSEMNQVRPRITELIRAKRLFEVGSTRCERTNKRVRLISALSR